MNKLDPELLLAGVYFLMLKGEIIYVGQSEKLLFRVAKDEHQKKNFDDIRYITAKTFIGWMITTSADTLSRGASTDSSQSTTVSQTRKNMFPCTIF